MSNGFRQKKQAKCVNNEIEGKQEQPQHNTASTSAIAPLKALLEAGDNKLVQIAIQHLVAVARLHPGTQILDADERSEEHTSELQSRGHLVCRLLLEKKTIDLMKQG